jgi:hypothetical protein
MYTIEFETEIENGTIRVPKKYRRRLQNQVGKGVWVIIQMSGSESQTDYVEHLLTNPIRDESFVPLRRDQVHERN